ncbi:YbfB/YjiJ family MFS transporter [Pseudoduganella sp. RAF53_2]|uniref:YbfB/YjiJ family MFS transporter n=1 Tax=unclassified Pseudoduganella TaxID=2637179 RepID=UPI003F96FE63
MASSPSVGRSIFAALCASLVGIGLARFAYTPLIPPLIEAHWFAANDVLYLGAANLVGYLVGAVGGRPLASRLSARRTLQWMMALAALAFFACAVPVSVAWFFAWRFLSGVAGGIIMVLAAITVLPHIPVEKRGMASGAIFLGLGIGIAASGTLVPLLLKVGLWQTWAGLGVVSALLTAASWQGWPSAAPATPRNAPAAGTSAASADPVSAAVAATAAVQTEADAETTAVEAAAEANAVATAVEAASEADAEAVEAAATAAESGGTAAGGRGATAAGASTHPAATADGGAEMTVLYVQYALMAVGLVPMMIFLVDYIARGLGLGAQTGAMFWIAYGIGAIAGPMMYGALGDRITPRVTNRIAIAGQIAAIALLVSTTKIPALILATLVIGTFPPGIVPIYLGQIQRILPGNAERQSAAWSRATTIYALTQAIVGYTSSWLLTASGGQHRMLFMLAAAGLILALLTELAARAVSGKAEHSPRPSSPP